MINDLIKQTYDDTLYNSKAFAQTSIESLFAKAKMHGLTPVDPDFANVLEIGCAMGANIIGQAINHPNSHFLGIDLSDKQIQIGKSVIDGIGCKNIELLALDLTELVKIYKGKKSFDYIICHGIYSWVPSFVQAAILEVMRELLSDKGVGFISYNCYPGWKYVEPIRDFMRFSSANADEKDKLQTALNAFKFEKAYYASSDTRGDIYQTLTRSIKLENINSVENSPSSYVAHEYMELFNQPFYFSDFVSDLEDFSLCYITDMLMSFCLEEFKNDAIKEFARLNYPDRLQREQMFDFLYSTKFRSSLITKKSNEQSLVFDDKSIEQNIKDMHILLGGDLDLTAFLQQIKDTSLEPLAKVLNDAYPASLSGAKCMELAKDDFMSKFEYIKLATNAISCVRKELKYIPYKVGKTRIKQSYIPYLTHFINADIQGISIATPLNANMEIQKLEIQTILMFDGKNDLKDIRAALKETFKKEKIYPTITQNGTLKVLTSPKEQNEYFKDRVSKIAKQLSLVYMFEEF